MSLPPEVERALGQRFPEHLERTRELLRQPSVSATGEGVRDCAEMVRAMMAEVGAKTEVWGEHGHPVVYGDLDVGADITLLEYEMYDVQPVGDLDTWASPPFAAEIHDVAGVGQSVVARGSVNSKGALAGHLLAWKTIRDVGELPVNLKIIAEGEEEISSENFIRFVRTRKADLRGDGAMASDYTEDLRGVPGLYLGAKGCLYLTIWCRGSKAKGGPMKQEIHSSNAVWVTSPVWRLIQGLVTLIGKDQRPAIDGIWERVRPPSKEDLALTKTLSATFEPKATLDELMSARFKYDIPREKLLAKYLFEPTVNICGLYSGYIDHGGTKTVLPHEAYAKVDIRLVPAMTVDDTVRKLRAHLKRRGFDDLEIQVHGPYGPARTDPDAWIVKPAVEAMRSYGKEPEIWPTSGGTMPAFVFDEVLHVPWVASGLGHGAHAHAPNEYASVDGMRRFMLGEAAFVFEAAEAPPRKRPRARPAPRQA